MKVGFGIITKGAGDEMLAKQVESIRAQEIDDFEICICGDTKITTEGIQVLPFDEEKFKDCIALKKNLITESTTAEIMVYTPDYIKFDDGWWKGIQEFGFDWDILMTRVLTMRGGRHWDWLQTAYRHAPHLPPVQNSKFVHYDDYSKMDTMYVPGNYWIAKRYVMEAEPLDNALRWCELEDVEWSDRVLPKYRYRMNPNSSVSYLKDK